MYRKFIKRIIDIIVAFEILILISPFFLTTWLLLSIQNRGKAFFVQERSGKKCYPFLIIKFKTVNDRRGADGHLLPDKERLTTIGKYVRKFSFDELPQLINVIKGEMSLIGPRPLLLKYLPLYSQRQIRRHEVRPGITGWVQVNGRNSISWSKKFELDVYYVDNMNFLLDIKIFWLTILKILMREGINQSDERPMMPFDGKN